MDKIFSKTERVKAALQGRTVDRPPISLWKNYPSVDQDPLALARAHVEFQEKYDLDFIKLTPFEVIEEVSYFLRETDLRGVIVGPGCATIPNPPPNNMIAARLVVERYADENNWKYLSLDSAEL